MPKTLLLIILAAAVISCNRKQPDIQPQAPALVVAETKDSSGVMNDSHFFWTADLDQEDGLVMKKLVPISKDSLSVANMISRMNDEYPEIQLKYKGISNDTIFLKINKSSYLTQQMGSSGAEAYLAEVTFNMTELDGVSAVGLSFKAGDHAGPAVYTRTDFIHETKKLH